MSRDGAGCDVHPELEQGSIPGRCGIRIASCKLGLASNFTTTTRVKKRDGHRKAFESRRSIAQDVLTMVLLRWIAVAAVLLLIAALAAAEHRRANDKGDRAHSAQGENGMTSIAQAHRRRAQTGHARQPAVAALTSLEDCRARARRASAG